MRWLLGEPERDPRLGAALRETDRPPDPAGADELRRRIMTRARPRLAALDVPGGRWWEWLSQWVKIAVPVGLAASLAAGLLLPRGGEMTKLSSYPTETGADSTLMVAAFSEPSTRGQVAAHLIAPEGNDWLLEEALTQ